MPIRGDPGSKHVIPLGKLSAQNEEAVATYRLRGELPSARIIEYPNRPLDPGSALTRDFRLFDRSDVSTSTGRF